MYGESDVKSKQTDLKIWYNINDQGHSSLYETLRFKNVRKKERRKKSYMGGGFFSGMLSRKGVGIHRKMMHLVFLGDGLRVCFSSVMFSQRCWQYGPVVVNRMMRYFRPLDDDSWVQVKWFWEAVRRCRVIGYPASFGAKEGDLEMMEPRSILDDFWAGNRMAWQSADFDLMALWRSSLSGCEYEHVAEGCWKPR
jgi:hypothetical protein